MRDLWSDCRLIHGAFEDAPEALVIADGEGRIRQANAAAGRLFGDPLGRDLTALRAEGPEAAIQDGRGQRLGTLALIRQPTEPGAATDADNRLARLMADWAAGEIARARAKDDSAGGRDPLTDLRNEPRFLELAEQQFKETRRYGRQLSLLVLEVDHFQAITDDRGKLVGDEVLCRLAEILRGLLRAADIACRLDGADFALLLPETGIQGAASLAERLATTLRELAAGVTVSVGITEITPPDEAFGQALTRARHALAQAKRQGRDRAVAA